MEGSDLISHPYRNSSLASIYSNSKHVGLLDPLP